MNPPRSIRFRFSTVFLLVLLLVIVLGCFSIWRLKDYHTFSAEIRDRFLRNTQYLGDLNNFTSDFRAAEGTSLVAATPDEVAANRREVEEVDRRVALAQHSYEHILHEAEEAALYARFQRDWFAYRDLASQVLALAPTERKPEAVRLYMTASSVAYKAASDTLEALTDLNVANVHVATLRADSVYREARLLTTVAVVFASCIVVFGLLYMRRSIADPLLALAASMRGLAANAKDVEIHGADRRDEIGEMARAVVVFRDNAIDLAISQRLLADQASLLAEKLAEEQRLTQLQRNFVSMASHEFRTPLTVIDGHAQRLASARDRLGPEAVAERAGKIRAAVARITSVIDNLIDSARLLEGGAELYYHPTRLDLAPLLHEVCRLHREVVPAARIQESLGGAPLRVAGDAKLLFQAFSNLLSNAIKYSTAGGAIRVAAAVEGVQILVSVADQGVGVPERDRDRLFERYYRGSNVSGIVGTGVGLYLVKTVVDLHGGSIEVSSQVGKGSRFTVRLPALEADLSAAGERVGLDKVPDHA